jgi:transcriptional regulator with XRE-family HTH domain
VRVGCAIVDRMSLSPHAPAAPRPVGDLLRDWRQRRRMSQLDLACAADISTRHLSFVETGRSQPSREMLMRLSERLAVPLRERNAMLLAAGYAPLYRERRLDDPALGVARHAIELVLRGHEPYPAIAVDRHWNVVAMNRAAPMLLQGAAAWLLQPPVNVLRAALHPQGVAPRIVNFAQVRHHLLSRLQQQVDASGDRELAALHAELSALPGQGDAGEEAVDYGGVLVPLQLRTEQGVLSFFSTLTVFGSPLDITLSELAVEAFFPADEATAEILSRDAPA